MFTKERTNKPVDFFVKGKKGERGMKFVCVYESISRKGMMTDEGEKGEKYNAIIGIQRYL